MKLTRITQDRDDLDSGSTLLVVVIFTGLLSILLISYLNMVNNSNLLTARSLSWNHALPMAEAGIEEAASAIQSVSANQLLTSALQTNGWTATGNQLTKIRAMTNAYYSGLITSTNLAQAIGPLNPPVIYCTGYVQAPFQQGYIGRIVRVTTKYNKPWLYGILARNSIDFGGNPSIVDSFDSTDPARNTGGMYDPEKREDHAQVACDSSLPVCIVVGSSSIYGDVNTRFGGSPTVGGSGAIGDQAFVQANKGAIQPGHTHNDLNPTFFTVQAPFTSGANLNSATVGGTNYAYVADSTNYYHSGDLKMSGGAAMLVRGQATIYVTGSVDMSGQSYILIAPGASLTLVVGGPSCKISGGGILNGTQTAVNCSIQCLPTCTSGEYTGGATFIGTLNAPDTDWSLAGGAGITGALTAKSFKLNGGMNVHYDESLGKTVNGSLYGMISWEEL